MISSGLLSSRTSRAMLRMTGTCGDDDGPSPSEMAVFPSRGRGPANQPGHVVVSFAPLHATNNKVATLAPASAEPCLKRQQSYFYLHVHVLLIRLLLFNFLSLFFTAVRVLASALVFIFEIFPYRSTVTCALHCFLFSHDARGNCMVHVGLVGLLLMLLLFATLVFFRSFKNLKSAQAPFLPPCSLLSFFVFCILKSITI